MLALRAADTPYYNIPEFTKLRDGTYTITADYWGKLGVGFQGYGEESTSLDLPSNGSEQRVSQSHFSLSFVKTFSCRIARGMARFLLPR